jgi:hypothetical protein
MKKDYFVSTERIAGISILKKVTAENNSRKEAVITRWVVDGFI